MIENKLRVDLNVLPATRKADQRTFRLGSENLLTVSPGYYTELDATASLISLLLKRRLH